eukprot:5093151-Pyramimonas_sp.AAC.1
MGVSVIDSRSPDDILIHFRDLYNYFNGQGAPPSFLESYNIILNIEEGYAKEAAKLKRLADKKEDGKRTQSGEETRYW